VNLSSSLQLMVSRILTRGKYHKMSNNHTEEVRFPTLPFIHIISILIKRQQIMDPWSLKSTNWLFYFVLDIVIWVNYIGQSQRINQKPYYTYIRNTRNIGHMTKTKITRHNNKIQNAKKMSTADPSIKNGVNSCARDDRKVRDHIYV
jgi:hypothetical protein